MRKTLLPILFLLSHVTLAQEGISSALNPDVEWGEGSIMLNDGTEIKGVVRYNDRNGLVSFQNGTDSRSFTARGIMGFEFFDEALDKQRLFYTLPFQNEDEQGKRPTIFEVLKDVRTFAIISKTDPVKVEVIEQQSAWVPLTMAQSPGIVDRRTIIQQTETVYFLTPEGEIKPYLQVVKRIVDRALYDRSIKRQKLMDRKLLEEIIPTAKYQLLEKYATENDLDFGIKDDLIKIFEYYASL